MVNKTAVRWFPSQRRFELEKCTSGIHDTIRLTLASSRYLGLLPMKGLLDSRSDKLRFTFRSLYTVFYAASLLAQLLIFIMTFYWAVQNRMNSTSYVSKCVFYTSNLVSSLALGYIGWSWPQFIAKVERIEVQLPPFSRDLPRICNAFMVLVLTASVVEHVFSWWYGLSAAYTCDPNKTLETFFRITIPQVFQYTDYALWKGVVIEFIIIQGIFLWNFNDLLVIVISVYFVEHFNTHNRLLKNASQMDNFLCSEFRIQYLKIVDLVNIFNSRFGIYILTSFSSNLYWICIQLFFFINTNKAVHNVTNITCAADSGGRLYGLHTVYVEHGVYFAFSLSFLLVRTFLVLLMAAKIHSASIKPLSILFGVPSEKFDFEMTRYVAQVTNTKVALSGLGFFYVTKTTILTLLRTLVTYELVLLQFNKQV